MIRSVIITIISIIGSIFCGYKSIVGIMEKNPTILFAIALGIATILLIISAGTLGIMAHYIDISAEEEEETNYEPLVRSVKTITFNLNILSLILLIGLIILTVIAFAI